MNTTVTRARTVALIIAFSVPGHIAPVSALAQPALSSRDTQQPRATSDAYRVQPDGTVDIRPAPYPKNPRYGSSPTPPLMRMPAPVVLLEPGQTQSPVWSMGRTSSTTGRTAADDAEFPRDGECRWFLEQSGAGLVSPAFAARQGLRSQDLSALRTNINPIHAWLSRQPAVSRPSGVCALFSNDGAYATPDVPEMVDAAFAVRGHVMIGFWPGAQLKRRGTRVVADGEISHLIMDINVLPTGGLSRFRTADAIGTMFEEIPVTHTLQGWPLYNNRTLYIAANARPLTRPVRMDRLLRWQLAQIDSQLPILKRGVASYSEKLARMESPEQRANDERIIAERARWSFGGDIAKARASFERERKDEMDRLRARADVNDLANPLAVLSSMRNATDQRLASLSPHDAAAQGCLTSIVAGLTVPDVVTVNDPHCVRRMEEANPEYYDRSAPRSAVQLVAVSRFRLRRIDSRDDDGAYNLVFGVDWQAFAREVLGRR
ncbi:MAG: hypothetical protein MUF00_09230 [Gemmatimonadaceae bacterium]|jgi:hypothetical protein|nr:hypothetical protein [Gemmatimonadaceae bacterium]